MTTSTHNFKLNKLMSYLILGGAFSSAIAYAAPQQETNSDDQLEVIEVKGYRGSINAALMSKREAVGTRETIIAEDIGKFPDLNVADSLARVPGISIEEDAGEGRQITVRGLGARYVKTTINGMESASAGAATDGAGGSNTSRAFDYNVFASELFTQIDINKTAAAELEDGGIAGNVNLQTARPFQYDGFKGAYSVNGRYNEISEDLAPRASFMVSQNWDNTFGALFSVAYSGGTVQSEGPTTVRWTVNNPKYSADGLPVNQPGGTNYLTASPKTILMENGNYTDDNLDGLYLPRIPRYSVFSKDQKRLGATAAFQYAPTDNLSFNLDVLHADLDTTMEEYQYSVLLRDQKNIVPENIYTDENNTIVAGSFSNAVIRSEAREDKSESQFDQITLTGDWFINDELTLTFLAGKGKSTLDIPYTRTFALDSEGSTVAYSYDANIDPLSLINNTGGVAIGNGSITSNMPSFAFAAGQSPGGTYSKEQIQQQMMDANNYSMGLTRNRAQTIDSENSSFKVDLAYQFSSEMTLKFGVGKRSFITEQHDFRNAWKTLDKETNKTSGKSAETQVVDLDPALTNGSLFATDLDQLGVAFGNNVDVPGSSTLGTNTWLTPDYNAAMSAFGNASFFEAKEEYKRAYYIKEEVTSAYLQLDFINEIFARELRGNIGVRYIDNKNTSKIVNLDHIYKDGYTAGFGDGANYDNGYGWRTTVSKGDDFLPSLNLAYDLTEDLIARFSYSHAITRPKLSDLSSAISVNVPDAEDPSAEIKMGAGPTLEPYKSKQYDVGLEWYFDEESLLGASFFFKDISGLTKESSDQVLTQAQLDELGIDIGEQDPSTITWQVTQLTNTPPENMWGAEFIYQQPFSFLPEPFDNLGLQANYTYIDYTRDIEDPFYGTQLNLVEEETSKNTYNLTLYYEVDKWSARFSYNCRGEYNKQYLSEYADESTFVRGYDAKAKLNFSSRYNISENLSINFEAVNLTDASQDQWNDIYTKRPYENLSTGRQFIFGLRGSF
ncbi:TonB-dependent receptor [Pseudoalteromonas sp. JB197]|uniref:TonB-dependent receptor n=2 Tax=Pseudoalteromonas TaxID=53246 RepID=UPI00097F4F53|nr:TonB-dependent receptor [Pseudoalteromonas sp. JB197]PCC10467.1 TonB-dependent receptor [Pseudoalteromonas sp. JB197]SJN34003.1 N-acetylglucosamine-regulated TonB-dependent outer membrane receptor [Pseudoalteromonas sp. JB197]|eukprot:TRINITY_DN553_c0_g1_i4.p1 TRINITY_DN553_c0_g1~~TRINITY_DN553_c0_g1_i4.p1  ORF type:complete len:1009 (-),score=278.48 TRINITY_DN553_c0_g1_i4:162-3188(-)